MSAYSVTEPSKVSKWAAGLLVTLYTIITLLPLVWIISTSFKTGPDSISYPPKVFFDPTVEGYVNLFTTRTRLLSRSLKPCRPLCKCWTKFPRKCWRKIPRLAGVAISHACDGRLRFSAADRDVWVVAAG